MGSVDKIYLRFDIVWKEVLSFTRHFIQCWYIYSTLGYSIANSSCCVH